MRAAVVWLRATQVASRVRPCRWGSLPTFLACPKSSWPLSPLPRPPSPASPPAECSGQSLPSSRTPSAPRQHRGQGASTLPVDSSLQGGSSRSLPGHHSGADGSPRHTNWTRAFCLPRRPWGPVCLISPSAGMLQCGRVASSIFQEKCHFFADGGAWLIVYMYVLRTWPTTGSK